MLICDLYNEPMSLEKSHVKILNWEDVKVLLLNIEISSLFEKIKSTKTEIESQS
jgi:hypothetical protein